VRIVRVSGNSMSPDYRDGDFVLVGRYRVRKPRPGDDIVFRHRDFGTLLKRIGRIESGRLLVHGLNGLSADPSALGALDALAAEACERVLYRVSGRP
jgi:phage repressor protein C with HTH and peptisase S24 domain